jgi:hypothetical protein
VVVDDEERKRARRRAFKALAEMFVSSFAGKVILGAAFLLLVAMVLVFLGVLAPGTAAEWAAAFGAIFAAAVALNIATRDRSERREERQVASLAQMRLVKVNAREWQDSSNPNAQLRVEIANYGQRPILQVLMLTAEVESQSAGTFKLSDPTPVRILRIVPTVMQPQLPNQFFEVAMKNAAGERWEPRRLESHRMKYANGLKVTIECIDADGQPWLLSNEDDPQRQVPQMGPPAWQRLWTHRRETASELWALLGPSRRSLLAASATTAIVAIIVLLAWNWRWLYCIFSMLLSPE